MRFEFAAPSRILFGPGTVAEAGPAAAALLSGQSRGRRAFLVSGGDRARLTPLRASLDAAALGYDSFAFSGEPRFEDLRAALAQAREADCGIVIGFGGGSALDLAKALAALLANPGDPLDYAEIIGGGRALSLPSYPCIAIPTTAGTGSEATRNAVLRSSERNVKVSLRSPTMLPALAIVDPELTHSLSARVTAQTGMDALAQLLEPFTCSVPNPLVDALCREALPLVARSLVKAYRNGGDAAAREDMAYSSLSGGLALANARLGAVHGFAGPLGGAFPIPHGAACAALLAPVAAANVAALRARSPDSPVLARYAEAASMLRGPGGFRAEDASEALRELAASLGILGLGSYGVQRSDIPDIAQKAAAASSMKGNPISLGPEELRAILDAAM